MLGKPPSILVKTPVAKRQNNNEMDTDFVPSEESETDTWSEHDKPLEDPNTHKESNGDSNRDVSFIAVSMLFNDLNYIIS